MPRKSNLDQSVPLTLKLPESVRGRLDLFLFSPLEGRVPKGRYQEFFIERVQEYFEWRRLDLGPYDFPPGSYITGPKQAVDALEQRLKDDS